MIYLPISTRWVEWLQKYFLRRNYPICHISVVQNVSKFKVMHLYGAFFLVTKKSSSGDVFPINFSFNFVKFFKTAIYRTPVNVCFWTELSNLTSNIWLNTEKVKYFKYTVIQLVWHDLKRLFSLKKIVSRGRILFCRISV